VVAVGETGLDFYRNRSPREVQLRLFREHLELAGEADLPVIIHFRNVGFEGIEMAGLDSFRGIRGVFHCFGGSVRFAQTLADMGFYIGFDGPLTYPGSDRVTVARSAPLDRVLLETDCPFLPPKSRRGERNEPAYVTEIAETFAHLLGIEYEEAISVTGRNACELFGFDE
jgi:TatD DNase family protein